MSIPDAPWIRKADNNGLPSNSDYDCERYYRVETVEANGLTTRESFDDFRQAKDFYYQCLADNVITVELWRIGQDGDSVDLIECFENDNQD